MLRPVLVIFYTIIATAFFGIGAMITSFIRIEYASWCARTWARSILWVAGIHVDKHGMDHIDANHPVVYMPNHASMVDILVLLGLLPVNLRFIFKQSILWIPVLGQAIYVMGMVPIDRSNLERARRSLKRAGHRVKNMGIHLLIFPEGTRSRDGRLMNFKKGGFYLAIQEDIDIVPISLNGSQKVGGRNSIWIRSGVIEMVVHKPIPMAPYTIENRSEAIDAVRRSIVSGLAEVHHPGPAKVKTRNAGRIATAGE